MLDQTRVLVVDDSAINREVIHEILDTDCQITDAASAEEALRSAAECRPHVILLDVTLPDADGYSLCRLLRSQPALADTQIIMVSANAMPHNLAEGLSAGADAYLTKPFDEENLRALIRDVRLHPALPSSSDHSAS